MPLTRLTSFLLLLVHVVLNHKQMLKFVECFLGIYRDDNIFSDVIFSPFGLWI